MKISLNKFLRIVGNVLLVLIVGIAYQAGNIAGESMNFNDKMMVDFTDEQERTLWTVVNDGVMGGLSSSRIEITSQETAVFQGTLSLENGGGFASVRRPLQPNIFTDDTGVVLRVKGDGRKYQFRVRTREQAEGMAYRAEFRTEPDTWMTIDLPFSSFEATFRGQLMPDAPALQPEHIQQIGFLIADKRSGPFQLEIDWIRAYKVSADA